MLFTQDNKNGQSSCGISITVKQKKSNVFIVDNYDFFVDKMWIITKVFFSCFFDVFFIFSESRLNCGCIQKRMKEKYKCVILDFIIIRRYVKHF